MTPIPPEYEPTLQELYVAALERIAKLTAALQKAEQRELEALAEVDELKAQNTRLKAPVSDEGWEVNHGYDLGYSNIKVADRIDVDRLIASRATRTPPQEG